MATDNEEKNVEQSNVRFDLDHSHNTHESDGSLDEVDEFLELSTSSNRASNSPIDSANPVTNGTTANTKIVTINGTSEEHKSRLRRYKR